MCKEVTTKCICDRCGKITEVPAKKLGKIYRAGKYPETWSQTNDFIFCENCTQEYNNVFNKFMNTKKVEQ